MAIAIAAASRTSPASCPPMRRESSGRVADAVVASDCLGSFVAWPDAALALPDGETVGNSPDGSVGEVNAPLGNGGNDVPGTTAGSGGTVPETGAGLDATTVSAILPLDSRLIGGQLAGLVLLASAIAIAIARLSLRAPRPRDGGTGGTSD